MKGNEKKAKRDTVKMEYELSGKGRVSLKGSSEGGWILGEKGYYTADPKWVGEKDAFSRTESIDSVQQAKSASSCGTEAKGAQGSKKVRKPKKKLPAMPIVGTGRGSKVGSSDSDTGGFARTMAAVERDGFALFPESFNTTWRQSGDPAFTKARAGLQHTGDPNLFKLQNTKTYKFSTQSPRSETVWNAIKVAQTKSHNIFQPSEPEFVSGLKLAVYKGKTGGTLREGHAPSLSSEMSGRRKLELKNKRKALNDYLILVKSIPPTQLPEEKPKLGNVGKVSSKPEHHKPQAIKTPLAKGKPKWEVWSQSWRLVKESKRKEKEREESVREEREREEHLTHVSPLDSTAQPMEASTWWVPDVHEAPQRRVNRTKWTLFRLRGGVGGKRGGRQCSEAKTTNHIVSSTAREQSMHQGNENSCEERSEDPNSAPEKSDNVVHSPIGTQSDDSSMGKHSLSPGSVVPQPQNGDDPIDGSNVDNSTEMSSTSSTEDYANWRIDQLEKLSKDFRSSPRMVVRGVYKSGVRTFTVKRKTEGNLVEIFLEQGSKILLMVKARMGYKYDIAQNQQTREKYGGKAPGGWFWQGHGWGHNVVQPTSLNGKRSDTRPKYVELNEAVLWCDTPDKNWHFSGANCTKHRSCRDPGCGVQIWHLNVKTFAVEERDGDLHKGPQADKIIHFSLIAFHSDDYKILLHRDDTHHVLAWLSKEETAFFKETPDIDIPKLKKYIKLGGKGVARTFEHSIASWLFGDGKSAYMTGYPSERSAPGETLIESHGNGLDQDISKISDALSDMDISNRAEGHNRMNSSTHTQCMDVSSTGFILGQEIEVDTEVVRLRQMAVLQQQMEDTAVVIASNFAVSLTRGIRSVGRGQCLFECTSDQILNRIAEIERGASDGLLSQELMFQNLIEAFGRENLQPQVIREGVIDFLWDNKKSFDRFHWHGPTEQDRWTEYHRQLESMRVEGEYAMEAGDLMVEGICGYLGVNVLLLNTSTPDQRPLQLSTSVAFGGGEFQRIPPLLFLFDEISSHYEEARPADWESDTNMLLVQEIMFMEGGFFSSSVEEVHNGGQIPEGRQQKRKLSDLDWLSPSASMSSQFDPQITSTPGKGQQFRKGGPSVAGKSAQARKALFTEQPESQLSISQSTQRSQKVDGCQYCDYIGPLANHLRNSVTCLSKWRQHPDFKMKVSDNEEFIVKTAVKLKQCPVSYCPCPGENHTKLPGPCLDWWREVGAKMMGFRGVDEYTTNQMIKTKISQFLKNCRRAKGQSNVQLLERSQKNVQEESNRGIALENQSVADILDKSSCQFCSSTQPLASHLQQNPICLVAYERSYLPHQRRNMYRDNFRLAVFDLSLLVSLCPNPTCRGLQVNEGYAAHVKGPCLQFYLSEVPVVYTQWAQIRSPDDLLKKLKNRRDYLNRQLRVSAEKGILMYRQKLQEILTLICRLCVLQGPLLDNHEYAMSPMGNSQMTGEPLWNCLECRELDEPNPAESSVHKMIMLGSPSEDYDDTLKPIEVKDILNDGSRFIFVPAPLAANQTVVDDVNLLQLITTVLVPKTPEAFDIIEDDAIKRAKDEQKDLIEMSKFSSKRPLLCHPSVALSVFYRKKLADIGVERQRILGAMSRVSVGKITTRKPNTAVITSRNPHYNTTKNLCLTNTCQWSEAHEDKKSNETAAISNVGGQIKIKIKAQIMKKVFVDNPELRDVIFNMARHHFPDFALIGTAPIVLQHIKAKIKLLIENILEPAFNNWDLDIRFVENEWTVFLVGYLYTDEFDHINKTIAMDGASLRQRTDAVISKPINAPTVSLNPQYVADHHDLREERADVIVALAKKVQIGKTAEPLSMFTMFTPEGLVINVEERHLRGRAIQLGLQYDEQTSCDEAIRDIARILDAEGLAMVEISDDLSEIIGAQQYQDTENAILRYHNLIWRTAGDQVCTLPRTCGENYVTPYIPAILEATQMSMRSDVVINGESCTIEIPELENDVARCLSDSEGQFIPENWREVSILDFIHSSLPNECKVSGLRSQSTVEVITSRGADLKWREAVDSDNQRGEEVFLTSEEKEYVRTDGDIRKLYEMRPASMKQMTLGQFASEYIQLRQGRDGYEAALSTIDEQSKLGTNSNQLVAGTGDLRAPETMMLLNGGVMKRRTKAAALNLPNGGKRNKYVTMLLWSPWTELERVNGEQDQDETEEQKHARLSVFPKSVFPVHMEDSIIDDMP